MFAVVTQAQGLYLVKIGKKVDYSHWDCLSDSLPGTDVVFKTIGILTVILFLRIFVCQWMLMSMETRIFPCNSQTNARQGVKYDFNGLLTFVQL